jgi:hypothetical protein
MATAIATPTQDSLEAQVFETLTALGAAEKALTEPLDNVSIVPDLEGDTITMSVTLPITIASVGGEMTIVPVPYAVEQ